MSALIRVVSEQELHGYSSRVELVVRGRDETGHPMVTVTDISGVVTRAVCYIALDSIPTITLDVFGVPALVEGKAGYSTLVGFAEFLRSHGWTVAAPEVTP